jgi:hypothetical protein
VKASLLAALLLFAALDDGFARLTPWQEDDVAAAQGNDYPAGPRLSAADQVRQELGSPAPPRPGGRTSAAPRGGGPAPARPYTDRLYALKSLQR